MERKAWWAAGTIGALTLAGLVTAGIAVSARAGDDEDEHKIKDKRKRVVSVVVPKGERGAFLGVRTSEETEAEQGGARVDAVVDDSPAERAGLEEGDVIISFDGSPVTGPMGLTKRIHQASPKDKVEVGILRDGKRQTIDVTLGERSHTIVVPRDGERIEVPLPDTEALEDHLKGLNIWTNGEGKGNTFFFRMGGRPKLGVHLVETTPELREHLGGSRDRGVLVGKVLSGRPADKAGVKVGDLIVSVDGDGVGDSGELVEALEDKDGETVNLEVIRDGRSLRLDVALPKPDEDEDEFSGPRAGLGRAERLQLLAELDMARQARLEAMHGAREEMRAGMQGARRAQLEAARAERQAMRDARQQLRRELVRARGLSVI
jgi:membrane-associated protease RseP (regulator of RpoE activity)